MHRIILTVTAALLAVGCATVVPFDVDGSRADGTIVMAAETGTLGSVDWEAGTKAARQKCLAWGYEGVEPFGGYRSEVVDEATLLGPQKKVRYERIYQCVGSPGEEIVQEI